MAHGCADYEVQQTKKILDSPSPMVLFFRGQALEALVKKLRTENEELGVGAVLAIVMLMGIDVRIL